jgi:hypothetical protein
LRLPRQPDFEICPRAFRPSNYNEKERESLPQNLETQHKTASFSAASFKIDG